MKKKFVILGVCAVAMMATLFGCGISDEVKEEAGVTTEDETVEETEAVEEVDYEALKEFQFFSGYGTVMEEHWFDISFVDSAQVVETTGDATKVSPYMIEVQFTEEGSEILASAAEDLLSREIYLRIDNTVVAMVQVQDYMLEGYQEGIFTIVDQYITTEEQAQNVVDQINAKVQEQK